MDSFSLYKDRIGQTLTTRLADAMEQEVITLEESSKIAQAILDGVNGSKNHQELMDFVEDLAHEWTLFGPVLVAEHSALVGQEVAQNEEKAVSEVESLLKENKIDEALATAGQANQESQDVTATLPPPGQESLENSPIENQTPDSAPTETPPIQDAPIEEQPIIDSTPPSAPELSQETVTQTVQDLDPNGTGGTP